MKKCEHCYLKDAKPCYECNTCMGGDDHFQPTPMPYPRTRFSVITENSEKLAKTIHAICCNGGCPPDKDCAKKQDCLKCLVEWLNEPEEK